MFHSVPEVKQETDAFEDQEEYPGAEGDLWNQDEVAQYAYAWDHWHQRARECIHWLVHLGKSRQEYDATEAHKTQSKLKVTVEIPTIAHCKKERKDGEAPRIFLIWASQDVNLFLIGVPESNCYCSCINECRIEKISEVNDHW